MKATVLSAQRFPGPAFDALEAKHELRISKDLLQGTPDPAYSRKVEAVLTWAGGPEIDAPFLRRFPRLRLLATYGIGVDHLDMDALRNRGIAVATTRGAVEQATAEIAIGLVLAVSRRIAEADRHIRSAGWPVGGTTAMLGRSVAGSTLGIVGLGAIGMRVARVASALEMRVIYTQRHPAALADEVSAVEYVSLESLLESSDIVSLHCPLTDETRHLIDGAHLDQMRPSAILINTARGAIVDTEALISALIGRRLAGAGLDVYETEPTVPAALLSMSNVVLSPHLGSATLEARHEMTRMMVNAVDEAFA